ncbi:translocase of chloroplast 120, chloroplastic-like isoform X2 [Bidens hawaiensis]|uniref:translocase of chloroplast 120, chloroplastic-like isoform X2 n=1 Tax=Bidens hawaiensis TaxID=980011 RepID=UPI0040499926
MENGVSKVELKVEDVDRVDVNGRNEGFDDGRKDKSDESGGSLELDRAEKLGDAAEGCGIETVVEKADVDPVRKDKSEENGVSLRLDEGAEKADVESVEEVVSMKVIDEESTSDNTTGDQSVVVNNNEPVDRDEPEEKLVNITDVKEEINASDSTASNQSGGSEADEAVNDDKSEEKETGLLQVVNEDSRSDNTAKDQPVVVDNNGLVDCDEPEEKLLNTTDVNEITASDRTANNQPSRCEADEAKNDDNSEEKVTDLLKVTDGESSSDNTAKDQVSELEIDGSAVGEKDEQNLLGDNGIIGSEVNEVQKASNADLSEDAHEVNKMLDGELETDVSTVGEKDEQNVFGDNGRSIDSEVNEVNKKLDGELEIDVSTVGEKDEKNVFGDNGSIDNEVIEVQKASNADSSEDAHEVNKKPDTVNLETSKNVVSDRVDLDEPVIHEGVNGDSMSLKTQLDVNEKGNLVTESKEAPTVGQIQDAKEIEEGSTSVTNVPINHVETTVISEAQTSKPINHEVKQDTPVKKEPELKPVIGVSLSTQKSATPDVKPNPTPTPNPTSTPSPAPTRPAGLGNGAPLLEPAHRVVQPQPNGNTALQNQVIDEPTNGEPDENDETREKLQMIRVKFLRLARRLGQTPHNVVVAQVLYRLGLAEQLRGSNGGRVGAFSFERASAMAEQLEAAGQEPLEFSCTIMVLGKTGVGKSATINSIFDEVKFGTNAFQTGTTKVQDVVGTVQGIKVRVIDTPGLLSSWADQRKNEKILQSVKRFIQKSPPDIVLYLDRLDMQSRDFGDMPLLRTITDIFGQSIWFNAIVVLTHAASAPPEGPNGVATSYDMFVTQRSHVVQQAIRQAAGDMRLMNPVSLVENHSACRTNRAGQRVLPNGQVWKPHLLLLSFASKILVEANMLLKLQDSPPGKPFAARARAPPLPYILSNLLQSRPQLKLPQEQFGDDDDDVDDGLDESSDDESSEYDELPPFKRLTSSQLSKLSKTQKKSYYEELELREKLFMKKQLQEEKKRRKMMKKMAEEAKDFPTNLTDNNVEEDSNGAASVPVAAQDMNLPASFDADNPTHRYRVLESANHWLVRPVLDPHGWDHDVGYEGINVEHLLALKETIPVSFTGQITKDKKDANLQMEVSSALKHGKSKSTTLALDMQTVGKEMSYALRSETRFINYRKNKASAGLSATYFGDSLTGGLKFEDKLIINKRGQLVVAGGAVIGRGDVAYGGSLEATLRDKDYPLGRFLSTIGLSVMDWHGDLALGWNAQSQIPIGRFTNLIGRVNLNNKGSGQVSVRLNSSEQLQIALAALVPLVSKLLGYYQDHDSAY